MAPKEIMKSNLLIPTGTGNRKAELAEAKEVVENNTSKKVKNENPKKAKTTKSASYYLSFEAQMAIDELQLKLRRSTGEKVSKSEIVEAAIKPPFLILKALVKTQSYTINYLKYYKILHAKMHNSIAN